MKALSARLPMRVAVASALVAAALVAVPAPALAATTVTITGGGWGHGIGMSQYGAYGRALNGRTAEEILEHYYSGAEVRTADMPGSIRVGLLQGRSSIAFTSDAFSDGGGKVSIKVAGASNRLASGPAGTSWRVEPSTTGGMRLYKNGTRVTRDGRGVFGDPTHPLVITYERYQTLMSVTGKGAKYALGRMEVGTYQTSSCDPGFCARLVVSLTMQKYLYGLGEVPSSWPAAALRSQAIAGRTYAYEKTLRLGQRRYPCDCAVYDSTIDQAYIGDAKRSGSAEYWDDWKAAVDDTAAQVILYGGAPIQALYSSSSGGHTEHNENVWGGTPLPYLRGVPDGPDAVDANPNHTWRVQMSWSEFSNKLENYYNDDPDTRFGSLTNFELVKPFGVSGRVTVVKSTGGGVRLVGSQGTVRVDGWSIRSALGLKDTLFRVSIDYAVGTQFARKYRRLEGAPGDPLSAPYPVPIGWEDPLGRAQRFERGRMTWRAKTDKAVWQRGVVLAKYDAMRREKGPLGMPTSDTWGSSRIRGANYVLGSIYWSDKTGARAVRGEFRRAYRRADGPSGPLRLPTKKREAMKSLPNGGRRQRFQRGTLYLNPNRDDVLALWGRIDEKYRAMGQASGRCGYPTSDLVADEFGQRATFQKGIISWTDHGGIEVECP